jgi:hypothetical protein
LGNHTLSKLSELSLFDAKKENHTKSSPEDWLIVAEAAKMGEIV